MGRSLRWVAPHGHRVILEGEYGHGSGTTECGWHVCLLALFLELTYLFARVYTAIKELITWFTTVVPPLPVFLHSINDSRRIQFLILIPPTSLLLAMIPTIAPDRLHNLTRATRTIMAWTITHVVHIPTRQLSSTISPAYGSHGGRFVARHVTFDGKRVIV